MLHMIEGCEVPDADALFEQYSVWEQGFYANVDAEKLSCVFRHFIAMQTERMFFILETPANAQEEELLRANGSGPLHRNVYYIDGLNAFGFGVHDQSAELLLGKYNVVTLFTKELGKYADFFAAHGIPQTEACQTAWDTFREACPGKSFVIERNGKTVFDLPEELKDWQTYLAERREVK